MGTKILSVNVRGLLDDRKRRSIFDYHRVNADLLICHETHSTPDVETVWCHEWGGGGALFSHGTTASRGVAIFYSKAFKHRISNVTRSIEGRYIICDLEMDGQFITLTAIYAPNQDCPGFFSDLAQMLKTRHAHKVMIGDFNLTLNVELDRLNTYHNNSRARDELENVMEEFSLVDIWRIQNSDRKEYSWHKKGEITKASRIDFALVSAGLDQGVKTVTYLSSIKTDHRGIYMSIQLSDYERGRGFWKFNTSLLQNIKYIECMNRKIEEYKEIVEENPMEKWENLKKLIQKVTKQFS